MIGKDDIEAIGKFLKTHALKGELNVQLDIDADFIRPDIPLIVKRDGIPVPFFISSVRPKGHFASLVKLDGIDSEEDAREFINQIIYARKTDVAGYLGEDSDQEEGLYIDDMIGFRIVDAYTEKIVGKIERVDLSTANALFVTSTPDGEIFIPAAAELISGVDPVSRTVTVEIPKGLMNLNSKNNK